MNTVGRFASSRPAWRAALGVALWALTMVSSVVRGQEVTPAALMELKPADLYAGFEAYKAVLEKDGNRVVLDPRVFQFGQEREGRIVTDPIDVGPKDGIVGLQAQIDAVDVEVVADVPAGAGVEVETRSRPRRFEDVGASPWTRLPGLSGRVTGLKGRYIEVSLKLRAVAVDRRPAVSAIKLRPVVHGGEPWKGRLEVAETDIQEIVRSPVAFHYERPDQPKIAKFRQDAKLDEVVTGAKDDFERLVKLMDFVGQGGNEKDWKWVERGGFGGPYPWDIDRVFELKPDGSTCVNGHCMSYAEILITAATALGYVGSRHWAMEGFQAKGHEIAEIWVPSLRKWVYFDPSLTSYFAAKKTGVPMHVIEIHNVVAEKFVPEGKDMNWWSKGENGESKAMVKQVGGKSPIGCRLGPFSYGKPMDPNYDWGWLHGYLVAGFVQMTPRNDFHSHPDQTSHRFAGDGRMGGDGFPFWVDDKTPPTKNLRVWYTRPRDFYWTLDQASFRLNCGAEGVLEVELGHSMPFFRRYLLKVDGVAASPVANPFRWKLRPGVNRLEVAPEDEFGKIGIASSATVRYSP